MTEPVELNTQNPAHSTTGEAPSSDDLQKKVQELEAQVKELKEKEAKYLYLYADFENFKKRAVKERSDLIKFGWENVARDLLQVLDNLDRALAHMPPQTDKNLSEGLKMICTQFKSAMQKQGVETVASVGKAFDPHFHEAMAEEASEQPAGTIIQEHVPGYILHGRLLRPARVVVSKGV